MVSSRLSKTLLAVLAALSATTATPAPAPTATCVVGNPVATAGSGGGWDINYLNVAPTAVFSSENFGLNKTWAASHAVTTMVSCAV